MGVDMDNKLDMIRYQNILDKFIFFDGDVFFHYYPDYTVLNIVSKSINRSFFLNDTASEILEMFNGRNNVNTIIKQFQYLHRAPLQKVKNSILSLLNDGLKEKYLIISKFPSYHNVTKTGSKIYYIPQKISLELTDKCNQKCLHCYGDFNSEKKSFIEFKKLIELLQNMINLGLRVITITGGEPFLYRRVTDLLLWLFPKVKAVGIISNGTYIPKDLFPILEKNSNKLVFQTSINGMKQYHDYFTGYRGSFEKVISNIRKLVELGIKIRITMNVNIQNLKHIQYVANLANELGAFTMSVSVAHNIGREKIRRLSDPYFIGKDHDNNIEILNLVIQEVEKAKKRFPKLFKRNPYFKRMMSIGQSFPNSKEEVIEKPYTCGAGRRSIHIDAKGNIQLCAISAACGFPPLGNLLENSLQDIMTSSVAQMVSKISAPMQAFCNVHCKHFAFCGGCIARGFSKYQEERQNCTWGKRFLIKKQNIKKFN